MIFKPTDPAKLAATQLYEARVQLLEAQQQAEYFAAIRDMLHKRVLRLADECIVAEGATK